MTGRTKLFVISGVALLALVVSACGDDVKTGAPGGPTPGNDLELIDEDDYSIEVPDDWTKKDVSKDHSAKKAIRYEGPDGEYFIVVKDALGSGLAYDAVWTYEVKGKAFTVTVVPNCSSDKDEDCTDDDEDFDGYILWKTGEDPEKVGGSIWYFQFGQAGSTTIDTALFAGPTMLVESQHSQAYRLFVEAARGKQGQGFQMGWRTGILLELLGHLPAS